MVAKIVIFQDDARFVGIFSSDDPLPVIFRKNSGLPPNGNGM